VVTAPHVHVIQTRSLSTSPSSSPQYRCSWKTALEGVEERPLLGRASGFAGSPKKNSCLIAPSNSRPRSSHLGRSQDLSDGLQEALYTDRLRLVAVEASGHDLSAILRHRGGCYRDDRDRAGDWIGTQPF
jgi:hypothetical protein